MRVNQSPPVNQPPPANYLDFGVSALLCASCPWREESAFIVCDHCRLSPLRRLEGGQRKKKTPTHGPFFVTNALLFDAKETISLIFSTSRLIDDIKRLPRPRTDVDSSAWKLLRRKEDEAVAEKMSAREEDESQLDAAGHCHQQQWMSSNFPWADSGKCPEKITFGNISSPVIETHEPAMDESHGSSRRIFNCVFRYHYL